MNAYLRNGIIALIANAVVFAIGWGCIVPDTINDQTHLFGLIGNVEVLKGNTSTVFGVCAMMTMLIMVAALVEALVEDYSRPRFNPVARNERPKKTPKVSGVRITDPKSPEAEEAHEDPVVPKMD